LLDLSNKKYDASVNLIVTYETDSLRFSNPLRTLRVVADTRYEGMLFDRYSIDRVVSVDVMPSWLDVDERGMIIFDHIPLDPDLYYEELPSIEFDIYYSDGTMGTCILSIIVLKEELTLENINDVLPEGDPMINSLLLGCSPPSCTDDCTLPEVCEVISKTSCFCSSG